MGVSIAADIPEDSLACAAVGLGQDISRVSRSGLVRAALSLYHGHTRDQAKSYIVLGQNPAQLSSKGQDRVTAVVPEELAQVDGERAFAIRVGLAMAAGLGRKEAETYARMHVRPKGRPRKDDAA
jgi:hypothetical protein